MVLRQTIKMKEMQINKTMMMLIILLFMFGMKVSADNIQVPNADNVLIYYNWGNDDETELSVTFRGKYADDFKDEYVGDIVIPETVDYGGHLAVRMLTVHHLIGRISIESSMISHPLASLRS